MSIDDVDVITLDDFRIDMGRDIFVCLRKQMVEMETNYSVKRYSF